MLNNVIFFIHLLIKIFYRILKIYTLQRFGVLFNTLLLTSLVTFYPFILLELRISKNIELVCSLISNLD